MSAVWAVFSGIIQGLTEFLPVSSSGHFVLLNYLKGDLAGSDVYFSVILHLGSVLSIIFFFRKKLCQYFFNIKNLKLVVLATLPVVVVGLVFTEFVENSFRNLNLVGIGLMVTGVMNLLSDRMQGTKPNLLIKNAFLTGLFQAVAILPGVSRSGSTIFASCWQGIKKETAAEFSFILSIPAILGAGLYELITANADFVIRQEYVIGFFSAFIFGILAINLVYKFLLNKKFTVFGIYCILAGILVFVA